LTIDRIAIDSDPLVAYLTSQRLVVATAESCTAGTIVATLSDIEGCGEFLECGFVTSRESKHQLLDVKSSTIDIYTLTSEEVAREMAQGALRNSRANVAIATSATENGAALIAFPELGLSAYTCEDLFRQQALLESTLDALNEIIIKSKALPIALVAGLPLRINHQLFNCAAVIAAGRILGIVSKSYLPNYAEFYEARQFSPAASTVVTEIELLG